MAKDINIGRPTVMTDETLQKLREAYLMGCNDDEACLYADIAPATLYNYQQKNSDFVDQKQLWKKNPVLKAKKTIFNSLVRPLTAQWYLERKAKDEFAERKEVAGPDGNKLQIEFVNPDKKTYGEGTAGDE